jgi:hypothetical protein
MLCLYPRLAAVCVGSPPREGVVSQRIENAGTRRLRKQVIPFPVASHSPIDLDLLSAFCALKRKRLCWRLPLSQLGHTIPGCYNGQSPDKLPTRRHGVLSQRLENAGTCRLCNQVIPFPVTSHSSIDLELLSVSRA